MRPTTRSTVGVTVIVPTYNRRLSLMNCIQSLVTQNFDIFEIIVVDDGSTDGTTEFLLHLGEPRVRFLKLHSNCGASAARNAGIAAASMPFLAFTDDDCVASQNWLTQLVSSFSDPSCGLVIGQTWYRNQNHRPRFPEKNVHNRNAAWPMTCNMAYRRCVFEQLGGFSNEYNEYHNEDTEMAIRAVAAGWMCLRALEAQISHQPTSWTIKSLLASAKNPCAAILLKRDYPNHHEYFGKQIIAQHFLRPIDYIFILVSPPVMPLLFLSCLAFGRRGLLFFIYWSVRILTRRFYVYRTAWECRLFVI